MSFFSNPSSGTQPQSGGLFGSSNTGSASSINPPNFFGGGGGLFGGQTNTSASATGGQSTTNASTLNAPTTAAPGSLFGATSTAPGATSSAAGSAPSAPSSTTSTNPLFGGSSGGFSLPKPADQSTGAAKPTSSFFSQPPATASASAGGLFGAPKPADSSTSTPGASTSTGTSAPSTGLFGGSLFGKPSAPTTSTATAPAASAEKKDTTTTSTAPTGGLFGSLSSTTTKPAESKEPGTVPAPVPNFNLFGGAKPDDKRDKEAAKPPEITIGTSTTAASSMPPAAVAVPPPSMLRGKTLEEIVNRWSSELETHVREFNKFAGEVAVWDRALIENGNNLATLYSHVLAAEREQEDINQSLDHIEQQQKDLSSTLAAYEKVAQEIVGNQGGNLRLDTGPADTERDKNYMLATDLYTHLDDLSGSLTQMIEAVNGLSLPGDPNAQGPGDDPMGQIAQILSSHLESLQWIDGAVREVESKVVEVEKRVKDSGYSLSNGAGFKSRGFGLNR